MPNQTALAWHSGLVHAATTGESSFRAVWRYQPLVPAAAAFALGISVDRHFPVSVAAGLTGAASALVLWCGLAIWGLRQEGKGGSVAGRWAASAVLLAAIGAVGATWHHIYWNAYRPDDIGHWARREARPARVRGVLVDEPLVVRAGPRDPLRTRPETTHTLCELAVASIQASSAWTPASGRAHVAVNGELAGLRAGDTVDVLGDLGSPTLASNPGEFDYAEYLRGRRSRALIRCDEAEAVQLVEESRGGFWSRPFQRLAGAAERSLVERLPEGQAEIAVALLLGRYELMEEEVTERYMRTGTMHILAISGQHLAILAGFLWLVLRVLPVPRKWGAVALALTVLVYSVLTGARPPVLRAAVLVWVFVGAIVLDCRSRRANPLALALVIVLAINPSDLFDRGLQLSFLAVAALAWMVRPAWTWLQGEADPLDQLVASTRPLWQRVARAAARMLLFAHVMSTVVWLANVPLLAARFHVVSPIVVPLTVVLTPVVTVALIAGLGFLVVDPLLPSVGSVLATVCGWGVAAMEWSVRVGAKVPGGHWYVSGPAEWWVAGFYVGIAAILLWRPAGRVRWRWATAGFAWLVVGFAVPALRPAPKQLECRVLAVGHGSAALLRLPNGRAVLVDAGNMHGPRVGSRVIAPALWDAGITRIDAVFLSHADVDHYNGLSHLAERFAIGAVFVPPHFAQTRQQGVRLVCDSLARHGVPIRVCWSGDRFDLGCGVRASVLHPPAEFGGTDNEQSLVLLVEYLGKRILLTGDVEGVGLRRLLASEPLSVDVLIAPHHGSRRANPPELAAWCRAEAIVVSQGKPRSGATLDAYRSAGIPVITTNEVGGVTIRLDSTAVRLQSFAERRSRAPDNRVTARAN